MNKMTLSSSLAIALLAASLATPGYAADLAPRTYTKAPAQDPGYDWSGFYVGASLGGRWGESD